MPNNSTIQNAVARRDGNDSKKTLIAYVNSMESGIKAALPSVITPERFTRIVLSTISANPQLAQTTPKSFLAAMMTAAQLGVEPNTPLGQAYLIPYRNHGQLECQFQLGYKGLLDLAYRSGEISVVQARVVYEKDEFSYEFGLEPTLKHVPAKTDRGEPTHVYAMFKTKDGGYGYEVMSIDDVRKHARKYSKAYNNGPWQTNFEEMALKTVLKKCLKYAPLRSDFVRQVTADESIKLDISDDMLSVQNEVIDVEGEEVPEADPATGEVIEGQTTIV